MSEPSTKPPSDEPETLSKDALGDFEFIIERDGSVTFIDLPPELLELAHELNPDDPIVCERRGLVAPDGVDVD